MSDAIGPYQILGELGRGAMAVVWRAFDTRLEREVALKEPLLPHGMDTAMREELAVRFVREGKTAARLNHPGIVTIFNAEVIDGRPLIAMELITGRTLASLIQQGALAVDQAVSILDQLLDAVGYAHAAGIVHRDIKPDNIFVTNQGQVKLADFGIAHVEAQGTMTQAGTILGTPGYMSPEQVQGGLADARSDIFSVGVIAYELLVGRDPFGAADGVSATTIMYRIVHEEPPELAFAMPQVPERLSEVVRIALAKDPGYRFATAGAMREALRGGQVVVGGGSSDMPSTTSLPSGWIPAGAPANRPSRGPMLYVGIAAAGLVVIVGLLIAATSGNTSTPSPADQVTAAAPVGEQPPETVVPAQEPAAEAVPTKQELEAGIEQRLTYWVNAWTGRELSTYMAFYAQDFRGAQTSLSGDYKARGYSDWLSWKSNTFSSRAYQTVDMSQTTIDVQGESAQVSFLQYFAQDSSTAPGGVYEDWGLKTMTWERRGGQWLITSENWEESNGD